MNVCNISRLLAILLFAFLGIASCKKTSYVSGEPPVFDTTGATPVSADPPVIPPPAGMKVSKTFSLDGSTSYMLVQHHDNLNITSGRSITITFWMKTSNTTVGPRLVTKRPEVAPSPGYEVNIQGSNNGKIAINLRDSGNKNLGSPFGTRDLRDDEWHHIACVFDQTGGKSLTSIYVDGVLEVVSAEANNHNTPLDLSNTVDLVIGAKSVTYGTKFTGSMDDVRLFSYPMSQAQIQADMKAEVDSATPNLIAAWDFENATGNIIPDVKGTHTGTIIGPVVLGERFVKK